MEKEKFNLAEMEPIIHKVLSEGGTFRFYPKGTSMEPMIHQGQDQVILKPLPEKLKKYQMILYKRANGAFVLHRIVKVKKDSYIMRGDNQFVSETGICREQMIGIVSKIVKPEAEIDVESFGYRIKSAIWVESVFVRRCVNAVRRRISRL